MMETILQLLHFDRFGWRSLVDILILAGIVYLILRVFRGTRAVRMLYGILVLSFAYFLTAPGRILELPAVHRVLGALLLLLPLAIVVLFQNHIRRVLAIFGTNPLAGLARGSFSERTVREIVLAVGTLAARKHGGLIVFEREQGLRSFAETGIVLEAAISYDLLTTIFMPHSPMHDGAVIIADGRIRAAACFLPLSTSPRLGREHGSRHRAAAGITEETDALAIVVSEETGRVSLVQGGRLRSGVEMDEIAEVLGEALALTGGRLRFARGRPPRPAGLAGGETPTAGDAASAEGPAVQPGGAQREAR
jgi:diadenylate cyclase